MGIYRGKSLFSTSSPNDLDNMGAFLRAGSDGDLISSTLIGGKEALDVNLVGGADSGIFAEDSAHSSGQNGQFVLAVRADTQGSLVGADGDYAPLQVDAVGRLRTITDIDLIGDLVGDDEVDTEDPLKIGFRAVSGALAAASASGDKVNAISDLYRRQFINDAPNIGAQLQSTTVGTTAVQIAATALGGRRRILVQNLGSSRVYVGFTNAVVAGVGTADAGIQIDRESAIELPFGPDIPIWAIAATGAANDVRVAEIA